MEILNSQYHIILFVLLGVFTLVSSILASATILNVIRLRNVRMTWRAGHLYGYPVFSSIFLMLSLILLAHAFYSGTAVDLVIFMLYFWMSAGWFLTSYFTSKRFITDNGVVKNINDPSQTIPWYRIRDFVETDKSFGKHFTFLYEEESKLKDHRFIRLDLKVPSRHTQEFKKLISHKLGRQINCYETDIKDIKYLNFR